MGKGPCQVSCSALGITHGWDSKREYENNSDRIPAWLGSGLQSHLLGKPAEGFCPNPKLGPSRGNFFPLTLCGGSRSLFSDSLSLQNLATPSAPNIMQGGLCVNRQTHDTMTCALSRHSADPDCCKHWGNSGEK